LKTENIAYSSPVIEGLDQEISVWDQESKGFQDSTIPQGIISREEKLHMLWKLLHEKTS